MKKVFIKGIPIISSNPKEIVDVLINDSKASIRKNVYFINAHCFNISCKSETYKKILENNDFNLNDGIGISLGAKLTDQKFESNLNGTDLMPLFLKEYSKVENNSVYLLGSTNKNVSDAAKNLKSEFPSLNIVGMHDGYFDHNDDEIISDINNSKANCLIVGMGVPLQEEWINENSSKLNSIVNFAVGAYIDFASNNIKRAPKWIRDARMEWVYRLVKEPKRLANRYLIGNILFFKNLLM